MAHPPDTVLGSLFDKEAAVVVWASGGNVKRVLSIASISNTAPTSSSTRIVSTVRSLFFLISDALTVCQQLEKIEREMDEIQDHQSGCGLFSSCIPSGTEPHYIPDTWYLQRLFFVILP